MPRRIFALVISLLLISSILPAGAAGNDPSPQIDVDELTAEERERLPQAGTADEEREGGGADVESIAAGPPAATGRGSGGEASAPEAPIVAVDVRRALDDGDEDTVAVIVRLRDQVDWTELTGRARAIGRERGRAARADAVVEALRATMERSQAGVRGLLRAAERSGGARDVRSFWIFNGFAATVDRATLDELAAHPDVASVTLDEEIVLPDPPGEPRLPIWNLESVRAPSVWGDHGITGEGVVVGIMDSGADGSHPALSPRYRGRDGDHARSWFVPTGENYPTPGDGHGHGTHVAGTIVGGAPGEITGVAPDAEWIMAKIFRDSGATSTSIIHAGFEWMLAPGGDPAAAPDLVSNSWGSAATYNTEFLPDVQAWLAAGIVPIFAAGNDGPGSQTIGSPGSFTEVIAVGATDVNDLVAGFSSRGPVIWDGEPMIKPDIAAPGAAIYSTWPLANDPDGYHTISGTSMATPHVAGVVALLLEADPDMEVGTVRELLTSTARVEPHMGTVPNNDYGDGIVDAEAVIVAATLSGRLSGTVTGPGGPVAATVAIPELGLRTTSDPATGFYELVVREGSWELEVSAYGYVTHRQAIEIAIDEERSLDVVLDEADVHTVSGSVTADGAPVAGAVVRAEGAPIGPDYTDADGAFSFEIAAGTYTISADATGYRRASDTVVVDGNLNLSFELTPLEQGSAPAWTQYQNNAARTGFSAEALAGSALERAWSTRLSGQAFFSSPVVADGRLYLATSNGRLTALELATGDELWTASIGVDTRSTPAIADGRVFVGGGQDGVFRALDAATGAPVWSFPTGDWLTYAAPTEVEGTVYFGTGFANGPGGWIYALDAATGAEQWRTFVGGQVFFAPAVGGGLVFAASYDEMRLAALDATTGEEVWALQRDDDTFLSMPSHADGRLYVTTTGLDSVSGSILALDATTGAVIWEAGDHGDGAGNAPVVFDDLLIAGSDAKNWVRAYDRATGTVRWTAPIGAAVSNSQLAADGVIVGGSQQDHRAWALDAYTGALLWEETLSDNVLSAPALADGRLVVATRRGDVYAYTAPGVVAGIVADTEGAPLDGSVTILETDTRVETDPQTGAYELRHTAGELTAEARAYGYLAESQPVVIRGGQTTELDFALAPAGEGSLVGTVVDEAGDSLAGVEVRLDDTPLDAVTSGDDGSFGWSTVAEGSYGLTAALDGYAPASLEVTVAAGETTEVEIILPRYEIAVTGDYGGAISRVLADAGYLVETTTAAAIADRARDYRLIVANGAQDDPGEEAFTALVTNAAGSETSVLFLDTWGLSYGSIEHLRKYLGDPATTGSGYNDGEVSLVVRAEHPLTASLGAGDRVPILAPGTEYAWFGGYSGTSLADVYIGEAGRTVGSGIGYAPTSFGSANVLLSLHGASPWSGPTLSWQPVARTVFMDAVGYALDPAYGAVAGTVTGAEGAGVPARVTVVETGERTTAAADGTYELLLAPGDVTLRFERIGFETVEHTVSIAARDAVTLDVTLASSGLGSLSGTVTGPSGPLAGATVSVDGTDHATTTDEAGAYALDGVPGGTYSVSVAADGHVSRTIEGVEIVDGVVTELDVELRASLRVAVIGDYLGRLAGFLAEHEVIATSTGWEAIDDLDAYDVVIVNDPSDPGEAAFLAYLDALDAAGVSAIFMTDWTNSGGGIQLLNEHLGDPATYDREWGAGVVNHVPLLPDHPLYDGLDTSGPIQILTDHTNSAFFDDYSGIPVSDYEAGNRGVIGTGAAFEPRTATSVRLLLSGLGANSFSQPGDEWTPEGERVVLNAIDWVAAPNLAILSGRVTDTDGAPVGARVEIVETGLGADTGEDGGYAIGHLGGDYGVEVRAFGYTTRGFDVTLVEGENTTLDVELEIGEVGTIAGSVTSAGDISPQAAAGDPLAGATVQLVGHPRSAVSGDDGSFVLEHVEPGTYELEVAADGHVRRIVEDVTVAVGSETRADVALRVSPTVGIVDDCQQRSLCEDKAQRYLASWGYEVEELTWADLDRIGELDLILANLGDFPRDDPGAPGLAAFRDAADRAHVPIVWADQYQRGSIRYLRDYEGNPTVREEARNRGVVHARILADHPLTAGFEVGTDVPILGANGEHAWFDGYSGETVATLVTSAGEVGSTVAYRGRTASTVDVLVSALGITYYTWPEIGDEPAGLWNENTERLFHNAINYALDAPPLAAEATGALTSSAGGTLLGEVRLVETGEVVRSREGDGTYLLPLQPGSWTVEANAFGHASEQRSVTVEAGQVVRVDITLTSDASGALAGTVTDASDAPIAGAEVTLDGTPLSATTDASGAFRIDAVPVGDYTAEVRAGGYETVREPVTITDGATTPLNVRLTQSRVVAVAGDYLRSGTYRISELLENAGYESRQWSWSDVHQHVDELGDVALVILNGNGSDPTAAELTTFVEAADAAEVPIIAAGQYGGGALEDLRDAFGDPPAVGWSFTAGGIHYRPAVEHPIFDGFALGEPIELVRDPGGGNQQYLYFAGYSGAEVATLEGADPGGDGHVGDGVAYRFSSPTSVHLLLASLGASFYGYPGADGDWTADAERVYLNAVAWAIEATQGEVHGTVVSGGEPVADATVTAVEVGAETRTAADGTYRLGVPDGTHTIRVTRVGYEPFEATVSVAESESVRLDVELVRIPRGAISGSVVDDETGAPIDGAPVALDGPATDEALTGADGAFGFDDLLPGTYSLSVELGGYLPVAEEVEVVAGETVDVTLRLIPNDIGVLGDVDGAFIDFLRDNGLAAEELSWTDAGLVDRYEVVIVNGGDPSEAEFTAMVEAADVAETSVIFTGSWGVETGGIRLLERHGSDEVTVADHGYRDGAVSITGFDAEHPLFAGLDDPFAPVAVDGYWSALEGYIGHHVADVAVEASADGEPAGIGVAYDHRSAASVHVLLATSAVTELIGPGYGWTEDGARLILNAVAWAREIEQALPASPTLVTDDPSPTTADTATLYGTAEFRSTVTVLRDGAVLASVEPDRDGSFSVEVDLVEGPNGFVAVATNHAGDSPPSSEVVVVRDTTGPFLDWTPADGEGFFDDAITVTGTAIDEYAPPVTLAVNGEPVAIAEDGGWTTSVALAEGANEVRVVATDALGNETVEVRTVGHVPYSAEWQVAAGNGRGVLPVFLAVADAGGAPTQVTSALLEVIDAEGTIADARPMSWEDEDERYHALVPQLPRGTYVLVGRLVVDGWNVTLIGPEVTRR